MRFGLLGANVSQSFSKIIHEQLNPTRYELKSLTEKELLEFLEKSDFEGVNVTIPYKQTVIPYLDELSPEASRIEAVNTIINKDGKKTGYNTDYLGLRWLFENNQIAIDGKKVAVLGSGGAARVANVLCQDLGAENVEIISRNKSQYLSYQDLANYQPNIIIDATPNGMVGHDFVEHLNFAELSELEVFIDLVYNPLLTPAMQKAANYQIKVVNGIDMLVAQAVAASQLFHETKYPKESIVNLVNKIKQDSYNIVLIGMPTAGKTSLGEMLATKMNRAWLDTDQIIEKRAGKSITAIFNEEGEASFRDLEQEIIKEIAQEHQQVISLGGGAVLNKQNITALAQNGLFIFIDRPLALLQAASDRPLLKDEDSLTKMFHERYPIYQALADIKIQNNQTLSRATEKIEESFYAYFNS